MAVDMKRSTNSAPVSLSTSYLIGSAFIGISMMTLKSSGRFRPDPTLSRFMRYSIDIDAGVCSGSIIRRQCGLPGEAMTAGEASMIGGVLRASVQILRDFLQQLGFLVGFPEEVVDAELIRAAAVFFRGT